MKISGGEFKGKNIMVPKGIRPLSLMVKEACFNILGDELKGARVLDLFAGSGALGLEAMSRGADEGTFVDSQKSSVKAMEANIAGLDLGQKTRVFLRDGVAAIKDFCRQNRDFNFIFLDPPYHEGLVTKALQALGEYDILAPSGYIISLSYIKDNIGEAIIGFELILERKYGQTLLSIYRKQ